MEDYADLFITLSKPAENKYSLELRFSRPDNQAEMHPVQGECEIRTAEIRLKNMPKETGSLLRDDLFADPTTKSFFSQCLAAAQSANLKPRLRLLIDRSARELHSLRWETLLYPENDDFLALDQNLLFSRFLFSSDWSRVELRPKGELRALVVVSSPNDLDEWGDLPDGQSLAAVDVAGELQRAKTSLEGIEKIDVMESRPSEPGRASLANLLGCLQEGYDILYLVCHGVLDRVKRQDLNSPRHPFLWLEKEDGSSQRADGEELVRRIEQLEPARRPRLIVLASCQSAGTKQSDDRGALAALGPRLAEVGVPGVLAMQANVTMQTIETFMPAFFKKLIDTGRVDLAAAAGRALVQDRLDWWAPVLFLRLRGGQLWYQTSVSGAASEFDFWQGLLSSLRDKHCTPVIGPGTLNFLTGSLGEIAREWAVKNRYPLVTHSQEDLSQVSQYLSSYMGVIPENFLIRYLIGRLRGLFRELLPLDLLEPDLDDLEVIEQASLLNKMISIVGEHRRLNDPNDLYAVLASLPVKIYITTNPDQLLEDALRATKKKEPQSLYFCWKNRLNTPKNIERFNGLSDPTVRQPLVYHLFGSLEAPESLVLTEDDYFDYLMWINKTNPQIPIPMQVLNAWTDNALVFLGFKMSEWPFRMLFRSILNEERRQTRSKGYASLDVQVQPGDDHIHPDRALKYLERFFANEKFNIFWGSPDDFMKELRRQRSAGGNP